MKVTVLCSVVCSCVLVSLVLSQTAPEKQCVFKRESPVKITVNSRRADNGKWTSQVGIEHVSDRNISQSKEPNEWQVNVQSSVTQCEWTKSSLTILLTITAPPPGVAEGYELFPDVGYYKFHPEIETWPRAREVCAEEGAHLAIINSEKESSVMKQIFARHPKIPGADHNDWAWIGVYEGKTGGQYFTIFDEPLNSTGFVRWGPNQPNVVGSEAYLLVHRGTGGLGDTYRQYKDAFFCERELF